MNPFRDLLNGAQAPNPRNIPIEFNQIAPMSFADQRDAEGNDVVLKMLKEWEDKKRAYIEFLRGRQNAPQMQMPNVAPNKNAALLGGLAALIGALTGDKSAVPAFGQFAGGLQQDAQAKAQRLLQEQQMKMQAQAQKDKALGDLLGFQLEDAQNAYSRANAADVANRKATKETADAEAERAYGIWKTKAEIEARKDIAAGNQDAQNYRATLSSRPPQQKLFDWITSDAAGSQKLTPEEAFGFVNKMPERTARLELLQQQIEKIKQDIKLAPENLEIRREYNRLMGEYRRESLDQGWTRIDLEERRVDMAESKEQPLATRLKNDGDWLAAYKAYNDSRAEYFAKEKALNGFKQNVRVGLMSTPQVKPDAALMMELSIAQKEFFDIKRKRDNWARIMKEREAVVKKGAVPAMPLPPGAVIGAGAPASAREIRK